MKKEKIPYPRCDYRADGIGYFFFFLTTLNPQLVRMGTSQKSTLSIQMEMSRRKFYRRRKSIEEIELFI